MLDQQVTSLDNGGGQEEGGRETKESPRHAQKRTSRYYAWEKILSFAISLRSSQDGRGTPLVVWDCAYGKEGCN